EAIQVMRDSLRESGLETASASGRASRLLVGAQARWSRKTSGCSTAERDARSAVSTASTTRWWCGDSSQTGSAFVGSPVRRYAWQRQPPKSRVLSGQLRHGSFIHASPRNRVDARDS